MAVFPVESDEPGHLLKLFPDSLPHDAKARKAVKPDLEVLMPLPASDEYPHSALLALGSGSTERRRRGAIVELNADGGAGEVRLLDLTAFFGAAALLVDEINVEGAFVREDHLLLFNRGNNTHPQTTILSCELAPVLNGASTPVQVADSIILPPIDGIALSITDACALPDGLIAFSAVAEDTANSYNDGRLAGAAIGLLSPNFTLIALEPVNPPVKVEGLHAWSDAGGIRLLMVTDADDPASPAGLYSGFLTLT